MVKILVIEDADVGRLGHAAGLEASGHEVTAVRWDEVAGPRSPVGPGSHDVVLAALDPSPGAWDLYPTISTLAAVTTTVGTAGRNLAFLAGSAVDNPLLGLRLARAGVDRVADVWGVRTVDDLDDLVTLRGRSTCAEPSDTDLLLAGVSPGADPEGVVAWVTERLQGPNAEAYAKAFDPRFNQNACGLTRRQAYALRVRISALAKVRPNVLHSGGGPVRDRSLPRWNEVVTVANLCRGLDTRAAEGLLDDGGDGSRSEARRVA